jgi:hypothetical protein
LGSELTSIDVERSNHFLQILCLAARFLDLVRVCGTRRVAGKPLLSGFHEILRPLVVLDALRYPLTTAELNDAVFPSQAIQHDPDLIFR